MFWPSNSSSVMSSSPRELYGSISGLLRTLSNMGTLLSYVITITVAAETIPRQAAYAVFLGKYTLGTTLSKSFLAGLHSALIASISLLIIAGIFSLGRSSLLSGSRGRSSSSYSSLIEAYLFFRKSKTRSL